MRNIVVELVFRKDKLGKFTHFNLFDNRAMNQRF